MTAEQWGAIVTLCLSAGAFLLSVRRWRYDRNKLDAEAAEIYQRITEKSAQQYAEATERIAALERKVAELEAQVKHQDRTIKSLWRYIGKLLNGIKCLMEQIEALGAKPCWSPPSWTPEDE